jgi:hypothetical protein
MACHVSLLLLEVGGDVTLRTHHALTAKEGHLAGTSRTMQFRESALVKIPIKPGQGAAVIDVEQGRAHGKFQPRLTCEQRSSDRSWEKKPNSSRMLQL